MSGFGLFNYHSANRLLRWQSSVLPLFPCAIMLDTILNGKGELVVFTFGARCKACQEQDVDCWLRRHDDICVSCASAGRPCSFLRSVASVGPKRGFAVYPTLDTGPPNCSLATSSHDTYRQTPAVKRKPVATKEGPTATMQQTAVIYAPAGGEDSAARESQQAIQAAHSRGSGSRTVSSPRISEVELPETLDDLDLALLGESNVNASIDIPHELEPARKRRRVLSETNGDSGRARKRKASTVTTL